MAPIGSLLFWWLPQLKWSSQKRVPFFSRVTEQLSWAIETDSGIDDPVSKGQPQPEVVADIRLLDS